MAMSIIKNWLVDDNSGKIYLVELGYRLFIRFNG